MICRCHLFLVPLQKDKTLSKKEKQVPLRKPDLLIVITGGQLAYTREDGVKVIPLACLRD